MGTQFEDISQRVADFSNNHRWENFGCKDTNLCFVLGLCRGICFRIMFQDNAGGYDEYTGKVGSDGNEAGDKKKSVGKKFCKICSIFALPPKKVNVNPTIDTQEESHQANMGTHER